jgi:hypothetical protein
MSDFSFSAFPLITAYRVLITDHCAIRGRLVGFADNLHSSFIILHSSFA